MGVMAALARRTDKKDAGEHLKIALIDTAFNLMNHQLMAFQATGEQPRKLGAGAPSAAPYGVYRAADGEVLIATASEDQFPRLCDALELAEVKNDARFLTMIDRIAHRKEIDQLIAVAVENWTVDELMQRLSDARISAGRVNSVAEACSLPVVQERQLFATGGTPSDPAQLRLPLDPESTGIMRLPPRLDEHRAEILSELAQKRS
jgi:crotonobetainyl-CoA:carnitine CoA-transferase CaiB-like acyl-CoA transferase